MPSLPFSRGDIRDLTLIRGIIFDKDGTLFDFQKTWKKAFEVAISRLSKGNMILERKMANEVGYDIDIGDFRPHSVAVHGTTVEIAQLWLPYIDWSKGLNDLVNFLNEEFTTYATENSFPITDLTALLTNIKKERRMAIGLITCDSTESALQNLQKHHVREFFDFVAGYDSPFGVKPNAQVALAFCEQVGLLPHEVVIVGDSARDMETGMAAKLGLCIGVRSSDLSEENLESKADIIIDSVADLGLVLDGAITSNNNVHTTTTTTTTTTNNNN